MGLRGWRWLLLLRLRFDRGGLSGLGLLFGNSGNGGRSLRLGLRLDFGLGLWLDFGRLLSRSWLLGHLCLHIFHGLGLSFFCRLLLRLGLGLYGFGLSDFLNGLGIGGSFLFGLGNDGLASGKVDFSNQFRLLAGNDGLDLLDAFLLGLALVGEVLRLLLFCSMSG